ISVRLTFQHSHDKRDLFINENIEEQGNLNDQDEMMFDVNADLYGEEVVVDKDAKNVQNVVDKVIKDITTAGIKVSTVSTIPITTAPITDVEHTLAQAFVEIKTAKSKTKIIVMQEPSEATTTIPIQPSSKDKGKAIMQRELKRSEINHLQRFDAVKKMFDKAYKKVNTFMAMDSEVVERSKNTEAELKKNLEIVLNDGDDVTVDATSLSSKSQTIVDYKIHKEGRKSYYQSSEQMVILKWGLNIGSLKAFNLALLQKWCWRMYSFPNTLWVKVIKVLNGQEGGFDNHSCKFNVCDTKIQFWEDIWIGDSSLKIRYNRLYHLERDKDCLIVDRIDNGHWSWNWSRTDIGVSNMAYLHDMLLEISLVDTQVGDSCLWSMAIDGLFSVETSRRIIDAKLLPSLVLLTSWDKILPRKVNIFIWRLSLDRLPHRLNLSSRGIDILRSRGVLAMVM
nr:RNA-directed DNA polymerase, eukaryota, reverse transcriptase zinc-binding domain protein [Tanacetum cinerariifolium]